MGKTNFFIGVDISSTYFTISILNDPDNILVQGIEFSNDLSGFHRMIDYLQDQSINETNSIICLECTGVYSEKFCYYFYKKEYAVVCEQPLKVKRAFTFNEHKTDAVDSRQIAEYIYRFFDKVILWEPRENILEEINTLLNTRDMFVDQKVAMQNYLKSINKKEIISELSIGILEEEIIQLIKKIEAIENKYSKLIKRNAELENLLNLLNSAPGVGDFLSLRLMFKTNAFQMDVNYKNLASNIGICPFKKQNGTSFNKKSRSKGAGDSSLRRLLHLASWSLVEHKKDYKKYYFRKIKEGKPKRLVLNNIANKLLKILFAMARDNKEYIPNYVSINPNFT